MMGGTDHDCESEGYYAARLLSSERADDARYAIRAWARGFAWLALFGALGATFTALSRGDWQEVALGLTAVVLVFCPRLDPRIVYELWRTELIRRKLLSQPTGEVLFRPTPAPERQPDARRFRDFTRPRTDESCDRVQH